MLQNACLVVAEQPRPGDDEGSLCHLSSLPFVLAELASAISPPTILVLPELASAISPFVGSLGAALEMQR